jgi:hypothetical protein
MNSNTDPSAVRGPTVTFKVAGIEVIFRRPTQDEWDAGQKKIRNPKHVKSAAIRELCQKCLLQPGLEQFQAIFTKKPAYPTVMAAKLAELAGKEHPVDVSEDSLLVEIDGHRLTFHTPSLEDWEDYQEKLADGRTERELLHRELCSRCSDQPELLPALFTTWPALQDPISNGIAQIAGADIEGEVKKG